MKKIKIALKFIASLVVISSIVSCASSNLEKAEKQFHANMMKHNQHKTDDKKYTGRNNAVTHTSKSGLYKATLFCNQSPIPIGKIHDWTVHIEGPDGKPLENAKVFVFGGMPMHQHDFSTIPRVKEYLGNGDYRVEGIKFSMRGHWEMRFTVKENNKQDKVIFGIDL